jgi:hypothetical protein
MGVKKISFNFKIFSESFRIPLKTFAGSTSIIFEIPLNLIAHKHFQMESHSCKFGQNRATITPILAFDKSSTIAIAFQVLNSYHQKGL